MKHKVYWANRMEDLEKSENKILKRIDGAYKQALKDLELLLADLYADMLAEEGGVSPENFHKFDRYTTLETRLKELIGSVGEEEQILMNDFLKEVYMEEFKKYAEFMGETKFYNIYPQQIRSAVSTNWSGEHFSRRIWDNKKRLVQALNDTIVSGVALGIDRRKMNKEILKQFNTAYYCADRIVRTETMFIYNKAHYDFYVEAGITQYRFIAEIDSRTSVKCRNKNNNIFLLAEAQVGWNYPPLHPNCRSTVAPVINRNRD